MAEMQQILPSRACTCLNVRIWPQQHPGNPPDFLMPAAADSDYTLTYVGDKGVSIAHPQVTMRTRKIGPPIVDPSRCIRYTTLTCLLCRTVAYRVQQLVASNEDLQDGPLLPSPDWVEQETLLSSSGWIEVYKHCLLAEDITRLSSSSSTYSSTFGIALPQNAITTVTPTQPTQASHPELHVQTSPPPGPFLYGLKPLFPPEPFVPSHPVFAHLSSIAVKTSEHLRSLAEEQIAAVVLDKSAELGEADDRLRRDVEELWRKFVENLSEVEKQMGPKAGEAKRRDSSRGLYLSTSGISGTPLVSVRNFVPTPTTAPRMMSPSSSRSRVSSLSASLATSGMYHIRTAQESSQARQRSPNGSPRSPPPYSSHPSSLGSAEGSISSSLQSSPVLSPRLNGDNIMQPFKRSMDETRDTAASFRYFRILEADAARSRQATSQPDARSERGTKTGEPVKETGDSRTAKVSSPVLDPEEAQAHQPQASDRDMISPVDGTPRKRKVKFDIAAAEAAPGEELSQRVNGGRQTEELIFEFEEASSEPESSDTAPTLPFIENAQTRRRGRHRSTNSRTLPASLSSLRPASLPAYSALRFRGTEEAVACVSNSGTSSPTPAVPLLQEAECEYHEELDPQEEEILKLVAADTPSHRSAWKRNSKAWQLFVSRRRNGVPGALIPEETEDNSGRVPSDADDSDFGASRDVRWSLGNTGFAASLPVDISPLSRRAEPLSLASYQPKTSLSDLAGTVLPSFPDGRRRSSSATLRRASYAARDRSKAIDPGALDFVEGDGVEAEDDESDEELSKANLANEGRGRQRAFKILQARSKIPEAGMWMSLAS